MMDDRKGGLQGKMLDIMTINVGIVHITTLRRTKEAVIQLRRHFWLVENLLVPPTEWI